MSDDTFYCSFVSIQYIICECGQTFPSEDDLKKHLEHDNCRNEIHEYKCGVCEEIYTSEKECLDHYDESHDIVFKDDHNYTIKSEQMEIEVKQEPDEYEDMGYQEECLLELDNCTEIKTEVPQPTESPEDEHVDKPMIQSVRTRRQKRDKNGQKPSYRRNDIVCEVCGKNYASNAALRYHQRVHTGERPYKCTLCPKTFTMPLFLQVHLRTHTGERPYECPLCPKAFSNKAALLRHDRVHTGVKPYKCPRCGKSFTQSNSMKLHVNTVHLKQPAPYKSKNRKTKQDRRKDKPFEEHRSPQEEVAEAMTFDLEGEVVTETDVAEEVLVYDNVDSKEITYEIVYEP